MGFFDWLRSLFSDNRPRPRSDGGLGAAVGKILAQKTSLPPDPPKQKSGSAPRPWYDLARSYIGKKEIPGSATDKEIAKWLRDVGEAGDDAIPWCAAFVGAMLVKSGLHGTGSAAARSYLKYGESLKYPIEGCVVVFWRESPSSGKGHVAFYVRDAGESIIVLGGNQDDQVSEKAYPKSRVLAYRWPTT